MLVSPKSYAFRSFSTTPVGQLSLRSRDRSWGVTPNFSKVAAWDQPINSYSDYQVDGKTSAFYSKMIGSVNSDHYNVVRNGPAIYWDSDTSFTGFMYLQQAPAHRSDAAMVNEAMVKALVKIADAKVNLAVSFAEKEKTSELILSAGKRMFDAMLCFSRRDYKGVARSLNLSPRTVHKTWLEYKYGWTPLMYEVKGAVDALAQQRKERPPRFVVKAKATDPITFDKTQPGFNRMGFQTNLETIRYRTVQDKDVTVKIWCEIINPDLANLQQLGVTNPALVAWELVPYSFVFDWFMSVGNYLQAVTALQGITVKKAMQSIKCVVVGTSVETFKGYSGYYDYYFPWTLERGASIRKYTRSPVSVSEADLYPPTDLSLPSWQKMMTGLALLRSNARSFGSIRV